MSIADQLQYLDSIYIDVGTPIDTPATSFTSLLTGQSGNYVVDFEKNVAVSISNQVWETTATGAQLGLLGVDYEKRLFYLLSENALGTPPYTANPASGDTVGAFSMDTGQLLTQYQESVFTNMHELFITGSGYLNAFVYVDVQTLGGCFIGIYSGYGGNAPYNFFIYQVSSRSIIYSTQNDAGLSFVASRYGVYIFEKGSTNNTLLKFFGYAISTDLQQRMSILSSYANIGFVDSTCFLLESATSPNFFSSFAPSQYVAPQPAS